MWNLQYYLPVCVRGYIQKSLSSRGSRIATAFNYLLLLQSPTTDTLRTLRGNSELNIV